MADAVGSVAKIVEIALKIKEAATTARQNKKDCHHIKSRVDVLNKTLSHHENNADLMEDPAVMAALEALHGILAEALEVITECQEKRSIICVYCTAGNLSRQVSKVEQRISYLSSDAMLTIMSHQLLTKHATIDSVSKVHHCTFNFFSILVIVESTLAMWLPHILFLSTILFCIL
jgi:hypothetical protein